MRSVPATILQASLVTHFQIRTKLGESTYTVLPDGELDVATAPELDQALRVASRSSAQTVVLDLRGLTFMDVSGMRSILQVNERSRGVDDGKLCIIRGPTHVQRVFEICGMVSRLPFA